MPLTIVRANPLRYEAGLKSLMTAHDYAEFPAFFDRGYVHAVSEGSECWLGLDDAGVIQMNMTAFVHRFRLNGRTVVGGMLGNFMVATPHRTFFPALLLLRRVVNDLRESGPMDFIYGDPAPPAAQSIFRAARMQCVGDLERLVLQVDDRRWGRALAARLYGGALRARVWWRALRASRVPAAQCAEDTFADWVSGDRLQPIHPDGLLRRRLPGFPTDRDWWIELRRSTESGAPEGAVLVRGPNEQGSVDILAVRRVPGASLAEFVPALARVARQLGGTRLQVETLRESKFGREFVAAGFWPRLDLVPVFARAYTAAGEEAVSRADDWELTSVDMER